MSYHNSIGLQFLFVFFGSGVVTDFQKHLKNKNKVVFQDAPAVYAAAERVHEPSSWPGRHASTWTVDGLFTGIVAALQSTALETWQNIAY